ncbi:TolC family protein [Stygiobacter electus]|uniref:TolC family protein n=1 Tax=Stygiobacter electus TaxID=3032292 RepID=A0AAE3NY88_9BACT|nr:TolC family protein [Stygiobacter electus]MDF1612291.1 TolC family protein [Stygiobacter electus]
MKNVNVIISLIVLIVFNSTNAQNNNSLLDSLITEALQNNPQLKASRFKYLSDEKKIKQVTSWEAPQIGIEFFQIPTTSFPNPLKNNMEMDYYIQQMIPFPGKLNAMGLSAANNAKMREEQFSALKNKIIRELKTAFYELYYVQKKIKINKDNQELLKQFIEIAKKQYEVGMGKQPDIIRAQTELSSLINDEINLYKEKRDVETMLNTILNRPPYQSFNEIEKIYEEVPEYNYQQLLSVVLSIRPELKEMNYNIEMYKSELKASKLEFYPDIMARVMYKNMIDTKNDFWSAMVGVNIPLSLWSKDKYYGKVEENELNIKAAEEQYNSMKNMISYEVQNAIVKLGTNKNLYELNKNTVVPQAEQTLQSTLAAYKTGKTEFLMLIDAYRMLFMAKLDFYMSEMNLMQAIAQLEQAVGLPLNKIKESLE